METPTHSTEPYQAGVTQLYPDSSHPRQQSSTQSTHEAIFYGKDGSGPLGEAPTTSFARQSIEATGLEKLNYGLDLHQKSGRDLRYPRIFRSYVDRNKQEAVMDEGASGADHEPAILWTTAVFDAADPLNRNPTAIYYDDRPVHLQPRSLHTEYLQAEEPPSTDPKPEQDTWSPTWSGCVFEVVTRAHATFPGHSGNTPPPVPPPGLPPPSASFGRIHVASQPQSLDILRVSRCGISIRSPFLYLSISEIIGYYPSFYRKEPGNLLDMSCKKSSDVSAEFILDEPYGVLMHHFPQLAAFAQSSTTADSEAENIEVLRLKRKHVRLLCEHLKPHYDSGVMPSLKLLEDDPSRISFDMLCNYDNEQNPAQINQTKLEYWVLGLWYLETDGTYVGRVPMTHRLYPYKGLREVVTLDYAGTMVVDHKRGLSHTRGGPPTIRPLPDRCGDFADYDGILINEGGDISEEAWAGDKAGSPVSLSLVDPQDKVKGLSNSNRATAGMASSRRRDSIASSTPPPHHLDDWSKRRTQTPVGSSKRDLSSHQLLLLFSVSHAFALRTKQWFSIEADFCHEVLPSEESIENLVLDKDELETIRGLARRQNKAIAEWLHRPLLALTVAEIGTAETRIERELIRWFALAQAWNAVLLVDEADIFLERRQSRDLARNGLVSAFLRRMEYFKGLLFLTTNRVGQIDDAFISRVHIAIGYKPLSGEDRKRIWHGFFRKLLKERAGKIQVAPGAKKWVLEMAAAGKAQLNGRDIRNALQTAITLAEAEAEEDPDFDPSKMAIVVDQSHFQRVLDISHKFHEYVRSIRREDEKKRAAG
ncbi:MAG: hypothetical protein Q9177_002432, partial [Variospora cf. flavescens]